MHRPAYASVILILALGLLAVSVPAWFAALVAWMQIPPHLYLAAALRFLVGVTFLSAAGRSRGRLLLFFFGVVMAVGGIATPIIGQGMARPILDAWRSGGDAVVRGWGVAALLLALSFFWALRPRPAEP